MHLHGRLMAINLGLNGLNSQTSQSHFSIPSPSQTFTNSMVHRYQVTKSPRKRQVFATAETQFFFTFEIIARLKVFGCSEYFDLRHRSKLCSAFVAGDLGESVMDHVDGSGRCVPLHFVPSSASS